MEHNDRNQAKISGFPFPSGFLDFEITNQTEQTVNRKKSGFRTAPKTIPNVQCSATVQSIKQYTTLVISLEAI